MTRLLHTRGANCPSWDKDVSPAQADRFRRTQSHVYSAVCRHAPAAIVDVRIVCQWHELLFRQVVPVAYYAGNYRQSDVDQPCLAINVQIGGVPGTDFRVVKNEFEKLIEGLRREIAKSELAWSMLTPPQRAVRLAQVLSSLIGSFIRVHPFINGNGRLSRILWAWGLVRFGVPPQCRISPRPGQPYSAIMSASMAGDDMPLALCILQYLAANTPDVG